MSAVRLPTMYSEQFRTYMPTFAKKRPMCPMDTKFFFFFVVCFSYLGNSIVITLDYYLFISSHHSTARFCSLFSLSESRTFSLSQSRTFFGLTVWRFNHAFAFSLTFRLTARFDALCVTFVDAYKNKSHLPGN